MESERPIEKLLRQTAHRRQAQAGERFELHPADRRALQAEVARHYPAPPARTAGWPSWLQVWPRLVWAVGLLVVLGIIVWGLLPDRSPQDADLTLAQAPLHEPEGLAPPPSVSVSPPPSVASGTPAAMPARSPETPERAAANRRQAHEPHPPLAAPEARSESAKPAALAEAYFARREAGALATPPPPAPLPGRSSYADALATDAHSLGKTAALPPPSPAPAASAPEEAVVRSSRTRLKPQTQPAKTLWVRPKAEADPKAPPQTAADSLAILSAFSVEQSGNEIRVVDHDGSVYVGSLSEPLTSPVLADATSRDRRLGAAEASPAPGARRGSTGYAPTQTPDSLWRFRVAGTNLTLKQPVVFSWNFVTNAVPRVSATRSPAAPAAGVQWKQEGASPEAPLRISGLVILENGQVIPINAAPGGTQ